MKRIAVTGAAGNIAYSLLFRLAGGELFGNEPIALHLLDLPQMQDSLKGVRMELQDCSFPLLQEIVTGDDPNVVFKDVDFVFFLGAKPRTKGMERSDLLAHNGKIFAPQGKALDKVASKDVISLVVGNPCNTNCLVLMKNAPTRKNFYAMTRLDQNRAKFQLAAKSGAHLDEVSDVTIWGNHSTTQVPDFVNARIRGKGAIEVLDRHWLEGEFVTTVQKRGAAILEARGLSSAASAAHAALDTAKAIVRGEEHHSVALSSKGNGYGIDEDLIFSFPCKGGEIIEGVEWDDYLREKIKLSEQELIQEREAVHDLF